VSHTSLVRTKARRWSGARRKLNGAREIARPAAVTRAWIFERALRTASKFIAVKT
jgi:hypothetical protein